MGIQIIQLMNNSATPVAINSMTVGSGSTITTSGIDSSRIKYAGIYLIHTGTVNAITRQVSVNDSGYVNPWDKTALLNNLLAASANNSRFIALEQVSSSTVLAPFTRYAITMLSGGNLTAILVTDEDGA